MDNNEIEEIDRDLIFFFLVIISSFISFYIVVEKKKQALNLPNIGYEGANKLFQFNRYLQVIINIYFVINAYNTLEIIISRQDYDEEEYNTQLIILVSNVLLLISSLLYIPILDSEYVLTR